MRIGIIGLGDMGRLYARIFVRAGHDVAGTDLPENLPALRANYELKGVTIADTIQDTVQDAEFVLFSVETANIRSVVNKAAPFLKPGTVVSGQTSVKAPEIQAYEDFLPDNVYSVSLHALHGPQVNPVGQTLILINHRCPPDLFENIKSILSCSGSIIEILESAEIHDKMMADIQVVTHIGFESIGTSFMHRGVFPWENPLHTSGLDNIKLLMTLRIFSYKHHVYSGMAMENPFSKRDVRTYAKAENELFGLMISEEEEMFRKIIKDAKGRVFKDFPGKLMLNDEVMAEYSLRPLEDDLQNSHLSLLSMVLTWDRLGTNPYQNIVCHTPPFKLRVGMAEYLFMNETILENAIHAAIYSKEIRKDDLAFHTAVQEWAHIVETGDLKGYENHFERTRYFLKDRLDEGRKLSSMLIERLNDEKN
jgi:prephenate dehydrogenase (NADP+)